MHNRNLFKLRQSDLARVEIDSGDLGSFNNVVQNIATSRSDRNYVVLCAQFKYSLIHPRVLNKKNAKENNYNK